MPSYLKKRGNVWYVQIAVPRPLQTAMGKAKVVQTTGESDLRLAERKKFQIIADIKREIAAVADNDPASLARVEREAIGIRRAVARGDISEEIASDIIGNLRDRYLKANLKAPSEATGDYDLPEAAVSRLSTATRVATDLTYKPLSALVADYLEEKAPHVQPSTLADKKRRLDEFITWFGADADINDVTIKAAGRYVSEVLVRNGKHPKTNIDTLATLSAFFSWESRRGRYDHANPWSGQADTIGTSKRGSKKLERSWKKEELTKLFKSIPSGDQYHLKELSAIALYTGMRINEIAELEATDIDLKAKVIDISEGKTASSVREIPIHPAILPHLKRLVKAANGGQLFPTFKPAGRDKKRGHEPSKRFGYYRDKAFPETVHVINERGHKRSEVNFHSFRRSFITACEQAGIPEPTIKQIVGHSRSSLTYGLYSRGVDLKLLRQAINKVTFGAVDKLV